VRPLPRSLDPLADESLPGFLLRLSHRLEQPPADIAAATGLTHDRIIPASLLLALPPGAAGQFAEAARLSGAEASSLTLGSLGRRYPPLDLAADGRMRQAQGATGLTRWVFTRSAATAPSACPAAEPQSKPGTAAHGGRPGGCPSRWPACSTSGCWSTCVPAAAALSTTPPGKASSSSPARSSTRPSAAHRSQEPHAECGLTRPGTFPHGSRPAI
jgi:hypothetical protein